MARSAQGFVAWIVGSIRNQNQCMAWWRRCWAKRRFGGCVKCPEATRSNWQLKAFLAATLQVPHTWLMKRLGEAVVDAPASVHQRARPIEPQQLFGGLMTARRIDHVA
ncbi:MAG TPA: hypothetical protein VHZ24_16550, partial [Pirellulales bacterium]|nr:hypothetical protein [Pirellulales bacterium]